MYFPRSIVAKICTVLALFSASSVDAFEGPPGIAVRIRERTVQETQKAMQYFLPHYLTYDAQLKDTEHYTLKLLFGLLNYHFTWSKIRYE